jgi:hypothetical protein
MLGRVPRSRLSLLKPSINQTVALRQRQQQASYSSSNHLRTFNVGDQVWAAAYTRGGARQWKKATVVSVLGSRNYEVENDQGCVWHRHIDQLRKVGPDPGVRVSASEPDETDRGFDSNSEVTVARSRGDDNEPVGHWQAESERTCDETSTADQNDFVFNKNEDSAGSIVQEKQRRYPQRLRKPKEKWNL